MHASTSMHMTFFVSNKVQILFENWRVTSVGGLVGSCIAVFVVSILYECMKASKRQQHNICHKETERRPLLRKTNKYQTRFEIKDHAKKTCYYLVQFLVGYFLMLVAMTYNVWLFLAVVLGCGTGYFLLIPAVFHQLSRIHQSAQRLLVI